MRIGIDFGTTRTVVAVPDRGNYPIVSFHTPDGRLLDHIPTLVVAGREGLSFGLDALDADGLRVTSFKRWLSAPETTLESPAPGLEGYSVLDVVSGYLRHVRDRLRAQAEPPIANGTLDAVIAIPAHAHSAQRLLTLHAFREAGFAPSVMLSEPAAAGIEYAHRYAKTLNSKRDQVLVYDLGGGTFDTAWVDARERHHDVVSAYGIARLGGDDFDRALADLALEKVGLSSDQLLEPTLSSLLDHCREQKEAIHPNTRRVFVELGAALGPGLAAGFDLDPDRVVEVPIDEFEHRVAPLVGRTLRLVERLIAERSPALLAGLYVVGGASSLPVIARQLREVYGRRVHRSQYPSAAIAVGLAIAGDDDANYSATERFTRCFGVFRERDRGQRVNFDALIGPDVSVPSRGQIQIVRRYQAAHNIGHFRFVECGWLDAGVPSGDITDFAEVLFPFDPALRANDTDLSELAVERREPGPWVEERYTLDSKGIVTLQIEDTDHGFVLDYGVRTIRPILPAS